MTTPYVDVGVEVTPAVVRLNQIASRFRDFTPVMGGRIDVAVRNFLRRRFESEGRVGGGGKWIKLTRRYSVRKRLEGYGGKKILQREGDLMRAYTRKGDTHQILETGPDYYHLSVDSVIMPRAESHQFGAPKIGLPARVIIPDPLPKTFIDELRKIAKSYVARGER